MEKPSIYRGLRAHVAYWYELLRQDGTNLSLHLIDTCQDQWVSAVFEANEQIYIEGLDDAMLTIAEMCKELMANTPKPVAVFPLALVRDAIKARGTDHNLCDRFGYIAGKRMTPAVWYVAKDLSYVHCGEFPLVAWVGMHYSNRAFNVGRGCYINDHGQHVYPA